MQTQAQRTAETSLSLQYTTPYSEISDLPHWLYPKTKQTKQIYFRL